MSRLGGKVLNINAEYQTGGTLIDISANSLEDGTGIHVKSNALSKGSLVKLTSKSTSTTNVYNTQKTHPSWYIVLYFVMLTFSDLIHILMPAQAAIPWGFLETSTKFIYTLSIWIGIILRTLIFAINIFKNRRFIYPSMYPPPCARAPVECL